MKNRLFVELECEDNWRTENRTVYLLIADFISKNKSKKDFRLNSSVIAKVLGVKRLKTMYGPTSSSGFFFNKGRLYLYEMTDAAENGAVPARVSLATIGESPDKILELLSVEKNLISEHNERKFYEYADKEWCPVEVIDGEKTMFIPDEIKAKLDTKIDFFINNGDWYRERSLSRKLLIILEGPPGCGKSSIARYVADRLGYSLGTILTGGSFIAGLKSSTNLNMVVSVPDVDALGIGKARRGFSTITESSRQSDDSDDLARTTEELINGVNLSEVLNVFQGDIPFNNIVCVMSTNCVDELDKALTRAGRCDLLLSIGPMKYKEFNKFFQSSYKTDDDLPSDLTESEYRACDLVDIYCDHINDKDGFVSSIRGIDNP